MTLDLGELRYVAGTSLYDRGGVPLTFAERVQMLEAVIAGKLYNTVPLEYIEADLADCRKQVELGRGNEPTWRPHKGARQRRRK